MTPASQRLALSEQEAAESLGLGRRLFREGVLPHLRVVQVGARRLIPVSELERWLAEAAS